MSDRYVSRHMTQSQYEREILTILQEECAEIIVQVSKALRFGLDDRRPGGNEPNREAIGRELGDLDAVILLAKQNGLFSESARSAAFPKKLERLSRFMQHKPLDEPEPDARGESVLRALEPFARAAGFYEVQTCADDQMFLVKKGEGFSGALTARDFRRAFDVLAMLRSDAPSEVRSTPSARWRSNGDADPHGIRYDCERAALTNGHMTDDELANEVFLRPSIANLTAANDRIRWLSRKLEAASGSEIATQLRCAENEIERIEELVPDWRAFRDLPEAVEVTLHALRSELTRIGGPK